MVEAAVAAFSRSAQPHPLPPPSPLTLLPPLRHFFVAGVPELSFSTTTLHFHFSKFAFLSSTDVNLTRTAFFFCSFFLFFAPTFASCTSPCRALRQVRFPPPPPRRTSPVHPHATCISEESLSADACTRSVRLSAQCVDHSSSGAAV